MNHSQNTLDFYGSRRIADAAYKRKLDTAIKKAKSDGNEYFVLVDDDGGLFVAGDFTADQFPILAASHDFF